MYRFSIPGPPTQFPDRARHPLPAVSPAGPVSIPWPTDYYSSLQPQLGALRETFAPVYDSGYYSELPWWERIIQSFVPGDYPGPEPLPPDYYPPDIPPTFRADVTCPYGPDIWKWVIGTAVVMLVLMGPKNK